VFLLFAACSALNSASDEPNPAVDSGAADTASADTDTEPRADPFAAQPDTAEGLTNISADLAALMEGGTLDGACDAWEADPQNRQKKLRCGKWMFFYEGFDTLGPPAELYDFYAQNFPDTMGVGFSGYGLVPDPYSQTGRNLGMGKGAPMGDVEAVAFTCASCHFGQLPDGRYAVGAPNLDYDYGRHNLAMGILAQAAVPGWDAGNHNAEAIALIQPELDALANDWWRQMDFLLVLVGMANIETDMEMTMSHAAEGNYADWKTGTMDFLIEPLPLDDGVHTVHKILPLWGIPTEEEAAAHGMPGAMLSWTGGGTDLYQFLEGFILIGGGTLDDWPRERLAPLVEYIHSLQPPDNLSPPDATLAAAGEDLFHAEGCIDCHDGPRGSSRAVFSFEEVGTDGALQYFADPDQDGVPCCGLDEMAATELTHGVKAPRIAGGFWMERLLHNGAVESLEALLCLDGERTAGLPEPFSDAGHRYGCDLSSADREALVAFLRSI